MAAIVVAVDFSDASRKALDAAVDLAKATASSLVMVHAVHPLPPGSKAGHLDPVTQLRVEVDESESRQLGEQWTAHVGTRAKVSYVVRRGRPEDVVRAEARAHKATYIVVGSHGRSGLKRAVLGSVAESILRASRRPVLVVPA